MVLFNTNCLSAVFLAIMAATWARRLYSLKINTIDRMKQNSSQSICNQRQCGSIHCNQDINAMITWANEV